MYDLDTIQSMNARQAEEEQRDLQPLELLAQKLKRAAPPSLSSLVGRLRDHEEYGIFVDLVKEYLPEYEREILRVDTPAAQMAVFANRFEDRYFPLHDMFKDGSAEEYMQLTSRIPVMVMGMDYNDYESLSSDGRPAAQLLTYLFENVNSDEDAWVSLAEACRAHVPGELLQRVPEGRFSCELAHQLLDKTRFEPAALWGDYLNCSTGNFFLDTDYETLYNGYAPYWERENVEGLVPLWQQALLHNEKTDSFMKWLEKDLPANFKSLLEFMLKRRDKECVSDANERAQSLPVATAGEPGDTTG